ncbi:uncharacterized protein J3R85_019566 [Psidium guajava]|nr:uncharacterized protein J3R85_019566 [Psidium guajava]
MSEEGPKLYTNKPKKAQLKQSGKESTSPPSAAAQSYTMGSQPQPQPPPAPPPPKESFARRYKFLWPLLLTVNLAIGGYLFMRTNKKDKTITEEEDSKAASSTSVLTTVPTITATEKPAPGTIITEPVKPREPIPEDQQRELFKWILEEKRKIKPRDPEERKRLDEEKAILKQFIRAKSLPPI